MLRRVEESGLVQPSVELWELMSQRWLIPLWVQQS